MLCLTLLGPSKVSWDWRVSSEKGGDWLRFSDGATRKDITGINRWPEWDAVSLDLKEGRHIMQFSYDKDEAVNWGLDRGEIRNLTITSKNIPLPVTVTHTFSRFPSGALWREELPSGKAILTQFDRQTGYPVASYLGSSGVFPAPTPPSPEALSNTTNYLCMKSAIVHDAEGFVTSYKDEIRSPWEFAPDEFGRPYKRQAPDGNVSFSRTDALGAPYEESTECADAAGPTTRTLARHTFLRDRSGLVTNETVFRFAFERDGHQTLDEPLQTLRTFDPSGNLTSESKCRSNAVTRLEYDALNRLVRETGPEDDQTLIHYRYGAPVLQRNRHKSPNGHDFTEVNNLRLLDSRLLVWAETSLSQDTNTILLGRTRVTVSDTLGRSIAEIQMPDQGAKTNDLLVTTRLYDPLNQL